MTLRPSSPFWTKVFGARGLGSDLGLGREVFSGGGMGQGPLTVVKFYQVAAEGNAGELLEQEPPLAAAAETELADELLIAGARGGAALDEADELAVGLWVVGVLLGHGTGSTRTGGAGRICAHDDRDEAAVHHGAPAYFAAGFWMEQQAVGAAADALARFGLGVGGWWRRPAGRR